jgi:hypothetical protein
MKIIFHCISTENFFAKDRVAAEQANKMVHAVARQIETPQAAEIKTHDLYKKDEDYKTLFLLDLKAHQSDVFHILVPFGKDNQESMLNLFGLDADQINPRSIPLNVLTVYRSDWCMFPLDQRRPEYRIPTENLFNITDKKADLDLALARESASLTLKFGNLLTGLMIPDGPGYDFIQYRRLREDAKEIQERPTFEERESNRTENKNEWAKAAIELPAVIKDRMVIQPRFPGHFSKLPFFPHNALG